MFGGTGVYSGGCILYSYDRELIFYDSATIPDVVMFIHSKVTLWTRSI